MIICYLPEMYIRFSHDLYFFSTNPLHPNKIHNKDKMQRILVNRKKAILGAREVNSTIRSVNDLPALLRPFSEGPQLSLLDIILWSYLSNYFDEQVHGKKYVFINRWMKLLNGIVNYHFAKLDGNEDKNLEEILLADMKQDKKLIKLIKIPNNPFSVEIDPDNGRYQVIQAEKEFQLTLSELFTNEEKVDEIKTGKGSLGKRTIAQMRKKEEKTNEHSQILTTKRDLGPLLENLEDQAKKDENQNEKFVSIQNLTKLEKTWKKYDDIPEVLS